MSKFIIDGGNKLTGELTVHGAKNSVLPILAATLLIDQSTIHNCPSLSDVDAAFNILTNLGCNIMREGDSVTVQTESLSGCTIPEHLMREMRSSIVFLGAVIARCGRAIISMPGGCELGPRPIDLHLSSLEKLGVTIEEEHGYLNCTVADKLRGATISLPFPSVGATENIMLAACTAEGETVIHNPAREPEIVDLAISCSELEPAFTSVKMEPSYSGRQETSSCRAHRHPRPDCSGHLSVLYRHYRRRSAAEK